MSGWISSKLKVAETLLQQIDQQAAESLRKNEASRSDDGDDDDLSHGKKPPGAILPPLKDQLKKKKKTTPEKTDFVGNLKVDGNVNPKPSVTLTDSDWTELLSAPPAKTVKPKVASSSAAAAAAAGLGNRRQVRSGSNLFALDRKSSLTRSARRSTDVVLEDKWNGERSLLDSPQAATGGVGKHEILGGKDNVIDGSNKHISSPIDENTPETQSAVNPSVQTDLNVQVKNEETISSRIPINSSSSKTESLSASDGELNTDSDSDSDSESETEREERRKRKEKLLAEKAAAKAIEAIKDRENLVARLEGEKQSLEKMIDERAKQQAQEASELQMTMMETMDAVDLEKQKHNNTRMEALMKLAKLETTNAELAKSLATAQWSLEVEVKRVAELNRQIELKEATHQDLILKNKNHLNGNKLAASRGVEFEHEILEAEHTFVTDKLGQLREKAKTLETNIQVTRKEIENPTEVEVQLKRRLSQLTDHLIQKQAQVESLSSEKAMLMFRIEAVSRSLYENKSSLKTSTVNDLESGGAIWEFSNSKFQDRLEKGQKHIGSLVRQLDSIFLTGATFLRRNPMGRIWSCVYLLCLHIWVLYIFRSHTDVSYEAGSGAVISLENININNTGV